MSLTCKDSNDLAVARHYGFEERYSFLAFKGRITGLKINQEMFSEFDYDEVFNDNAGWHSKYKRTERFKDNSGWYSRYNHAERFAGNAGKHSKYKKIEGFDVNAGLY